MITQRVGMMQVAPCLLAIMIDSLGFGLVYPIITALFSSSHSPMLPANAGVNLHHFYLGLGYLLYPLCMFFGASSMGDLSDRYGRKKVLLICVGGLAISFALMGIGTVFNSIVFLMLGRALSGLMAGSQPIAQAAISDLSTPETKALNMSLLTMALTVGIVVGPLLGGVTSDSHLISWFNFSTPFIISTILSIISFCWLWFGFQDTSIPQIQDPFKFSRIITLFVDAFKHPKLRLVAIVFLFMQIGFGIYFQYSLVLLHQEYQYSNALLGIFNAFLGVCFALGMTLIIRIALKFCDVRQIALYGFFIIALCEIATALTHSLAMIWIYALPLATIDIVAYTAMLTNFSDAVEPHQQGWAMGISGSIMSLAWVITGFTANLMSFVTVRELILIGGISMFVSFLLMRRVR